MKAAPGRSDRDDDVPAGGDSCGQPRARGGLFEKEEIDQAAVPPRLRRTGWATDQGQPRELSFAFRLFQKPSERSQTGYQWGCEPIVEEHAAEDPLAQLAAACKPPPKIAARASQAKGEETPKKREDKRDRSGSQPAA